MSMIDEVLVLHMFSNGIEPIEAHMWDDKDLIT